MGNEVYLAIDEPIRTNLSWEERWKGDDQGLIQCWETGRERGDKEPELRKFVQSGALPVSDWKGGVETKLKAKFKYGSLQYLAELQGLRNEDLRIDLETDLELICTRTKMKIIFTPDCSKYSGQ